MSRFVVLSGPSGVGKRALFKALEKLYPELAGRLQRVVLHNDRQARPGELDGVHYHFRSRQEVEAQSLKPGTIVTDVRGDLQALELAQIERIMASDRDPYFEGNPFVPAKLRDAGVFQKYPTLSIFVSPLSREEILFLKNLPRRVDLMDYLIDVQRRKLLLSMRNEKGILSIKDLQTVERRCGMTPAEMREACKFDHVIPLHDGSGHDHWDAHYYPLGDAFKAVHALAALLRGEGPNGWVERWDHGLIP
ncbi:MAG: hypothetical protein HQL82_05295 [Magnetococcales bacterium]|nr:hypothetical protein [Magnetococcales bacterium]